jgi:Mg2+/Co2+ transporter CorB
MENMRQKIERLQENQEELRRRVSHLKKIIINDMTVNPIITQRKRIKTINMSKEEWNGYIESSISSPLATVDLTPESSYTKN